MTKYLGTEWVMLDGGLIRTMRPVLFVRDTLADAQAVNKYMCPEWKGPFDGPRDGWQEWHGLSMVSKSSDTMRVSVETIYSLPAETDDEAMRMYQEWQASIQAQREHEEAARVQAQREHVANAGPFVRVGLLELADDGVTLDGHDLATEIEAHFYGDHPRADWRIGRARVTVELIEDGE